MRQAAIAVLFLVAIPFAARADEPPTPPSAWSGEASAGLVNTTGNSKTESSNAKGEVIYAQKWWKDTFDATALHTAQTAPQTNAITGAVTEVKSDTAERYTAANKTDWNLTDVDYAFLSLDWQKDLFGPIEQSTSETVGYGRKLLTGPKQLLETELGVGARQTRTQANPDTTPPVLAVTANDAIGRGRAAYKYNISDTSNFAETFKVESGKSNTSWESVTELKISLVGKLFALGSYTVRTNTHVPLGTEKTDTTTSISLGWTFGKP